MVAADTFCHDEFCPRLPRGLENNTYPGRSIATVPASSHGGAMAHAACRNIAISEDDQQSIAVRPPVLHQAVRPPDGDIPTDPARTDPAQGTALERCTDHDPASVPVLDPTMRYLSRPPSWAIPPEQAMEQVRRAARSSSGTRTETTGAPTGSGTPPPSGRPDTGGQPARAARAAAASEVRRRVEVTLRLVLEVLDRRRRPDQLKAFAERSVVDSVSAIARTAPPGRTLGTAVLRRIHITSAGEHAAEICATYVRGRRTLAIAGRFERRKGAWTCTALHLA